MMASFTIVDITPSNVQDETLFCIKNVKSNGFKRKKTWFSQRYKEGLRINILKDADGEMAGFIEYVPGELAWRPIEAKGYMFVQCLFVYPKKNKNLGFGSALVKKAEAEAKEAGYSGICTICSEGAWMSDSNLFLKLGFKKIEQKGRFELLCKSWNAKASAPQFKDWENQQKYYPGWQLVYADQCPWHDKAVEAMWNTAQDFGIDLKLTCLKTAEEAQRAPSGFGVFSLLHDGKLLEDHYLSATRFRNILNKELRLNT
jgi:GNAT superfamily N-acetyltransferase